MFVIGIIRSILYRLEEEEIRGSLSSCLFASFGSSTNLQDTFGSFLESDHGSSLQSLNQG